MKYLVPVLCVTFVLAPGAYAESGLAGGISTPGKATAEVPADEVVVTFQLDAESDSFSDAVAEAEDVAKRLKRVPPVADGVSVNVNYDVTFMKQKKWGRGSKLTHRFEMVIRGVAEGAAQETLVQVVDRVIKSEPGMVVEGYKARLSDAASRRVHDELLREAIADARHNATVVADAGGLVVGAPQSIVVGARPSEWLPESDGDGLAGRYYARRSFSVLSDLGSNVTVAVSVWVVVWYGTSVGPPHNKVLQLTDPACHAPGGCNRTAFVLFTIPAVIDLGGMLDMPGPRQSGPQLKTTLCGLKNREPSHSCTACVGPICGRESGLMRVHGSADVDGGLRGIGSSLPGGSC